MSTAEWFGLVPLSKYYVRKSGVPGPETNIGPILPIASGRIEGDDINRTGNITGNYRWYRLSNFEGTPNTQGKELREYLLVCRGVSSDPNVSFQLTIPDNGFDPNYSSVKLLYTNMTAKHPGATGLTTWSIVFGSTLTYVQISTSSSGTFSPNGQSFFFYLMGI
jgi:hypothetical protein